DAAAGDAGVAAHQAVGQGQRGVLVIDAAAPVKRCFAVGDDHVGDGDGVGWRNVEYAAGGVAVHGQISGTGDGHAPVDPQFAAGEQDGAGEAGDVYGVPVCGAGEGGA